MPTPNLGLITPGEGGSDWDTSLNANFDVLDKGQLIRGTFGENVGSGHAVIVNSDGLIYKHNPNSASVQYAHGVTWAVNSTNDEGYFVGVGAIRSMTVWSGNIVPGGFVYSSLNSPGFLVSSYEGSRYPVGIALGDDVVHVAPGQFSNLPETITQVRTIAASKVGTGEFGIYGGRRGLATRLTIEAESCDAFKVEFHSGPTRVSSERLYETLTTSGADVTTLFYEDGGPWGIKGTDTTSPFAIFGRITVQGSSAVDSSYFGITLEASRFE